jgi:hypothetical protein
MTASTSDSSPRTIAGADSPSRRSSARAEALDRSSRGRSCERIAEALVRRSRAAERRVGSTKGLRRGGGKEDGLTMPGSRITWFIGGAVVALVVVAGVDALRSPEDEATASPTTAATTQPFSPTTTVVTVIDDEAGEGHNFVMNQAPEEVVDNEGDPLPACSQDQLQVSIPPVRDLEGDGFFPYLRVLPIGDCRQDYPYFRVALRDGIRQQLLVWRGRLSYSSDPHPHRPNETSADFGPVPCHSWEDFPAFVTVGYEPSPEGQVFRLAEQLQKEPPSSSHSSAPSSLGCSGGSHARPCAVDDLLPASVRSRSPGDESPSPEMDQPPRLVLHETASALRPRRWPSLFSPARRLTGFGSSRIIPALGHASWPRRGG